MTIEDPRAAQGASFKGCPVCGGMRFPNSASYYTTILIHKRSRSRHLKLPQARGQPETANGHPPRRCHGWTRLSFPVVLLHSFHQCSLLSHVALLLLHTLCIIILKLLSSLIGLTGMQTVITTDLGMSFRFRWGRMVLFAYVMIFIYSRRCGTQAVDLRSLFPSLTLINREALTPETV